MILKINDSSDGFKFIFDIYIFVKDKLQDF